MLIQNFIEVANFSSQNPKLLVGQFSFELTLVDFYNYLNDVLTQIKESYQKIEKLKDQPGDLEIIKKELAKINGLLKVTSKKLEINDDNSDKYVELSGAIKYYLENYSFEREIETMSKLYSDDSNRLRNIRFSIIDALNDKKLMEKIESIIVDS